MIPKWLSLEAVCHVGTVPAVPLLPGCFSMAAWHPPSFRGQQLCLSLLCLVAPLLPSLVLEEWEDCQDVAVGEKGVTVLPMPPVHLHSWIWLPSRIGLAGGKGLVTNLLITKDVLIGVLMGYNSVMVFNNYLVVGSSLLGNWTGSWVSSSGLEVLLQGMCQSLNWQVLLIGKPSRMDLQQCLCCEI